RPRMFVERQRKTLEGGEQLAEQRVHHPVADRRGDEYLEVREHAVTQRDQQDACGSHREEHDSVPVDEALEKVQRPGQRVLQDAVIEHDLQWPGLEQLRDRDAEGTHGSQRQPPSDPTQVASEDLLERRPGPVRHGYATHSSRRTASARRCCASVSRWWGVSSASE